MPETLTTEVFSTPLPLLHRTARALHRVHRLNSLVHLILSTLTAPNGAGLQQALVLMVNHRARSIQGIVGIDRSCCSWQIPDETPQDLDFALTPEIEACQRRTDFCARVQQLHLPLERDHNYPAQAVLENRAITSNEIVLGCQLTDLFQGMDFLTLPLRDHQRPFAVLVVGGQHPSPLDKGMVSFLRVFASQAELAMENCQLLQRIQYSEAHLTQAQERMIQQEKLASIGEMAASVAHELRNPLMAVGGFANLLVDKLSEGTQESEFAHVIARETLRLEKQLENILTFSKEQVVCIDSYRLDDLLAEILELELPTLLSQQIFLETELMSPLPSLQGDAEQIRQVLLNLIRNSIQAMSEGGTLALRSEIGHLRGEAAVIVEVSDTGGGIAPEVLRNIFNPFFTTKKKGTGLGLSVCNRIIERHGGEIEVINEEKGACFRLHLPVKIPAQIDHAPSGHHQLPLGL